MEYGHTTNTNLRSFMTVCLAVVIQVLIQSTLCTGITCYICENVQSSAECVDTRECASNEICRTEIRTQSSSTYRMYCQQDQACWNEEQIYESQCTGEAGSVCVHCCNTDLCRAQPQDTTPAEVATDTATTSVTVEIQTRASTTQPAADPTGITCYVCENVQSSAECVGTQECALNEICRTEIRTQPSSTTYRMACQQDQACRNEESIYESQCTGDAGSVCVHCCDTDLCRAHTQDTTTPGVTTDIATTQEITSTDTVTTQATTSVEIQTTRAPTTQPTTAPTARPSLKDTLYRLYSSERQVHPQYVIDTSTTGSLITCAMTCAQIANYCKSFGYDSMSGVCYVVGSDISDLSFSRKQTCNHYIRVN